MTKTATVLVSLCAMLVGAIGACGGGSADTGSSSASGTGTGGNGTGGAPPSGCIEDPFACPAGQTCWTTDVDGTFFECTDSGAGAIGEMCDNFVGDPSCGDGMLCLQLEGEDSGQCTPYCDGSHKCPNNGQCIGVMTPGGLSFKACKPPMMMGTGGMGGTGGTGGGTGGAGATGGADGG